MNTKEKEIIKNKRILVTGGLGFIGFNTACYFARSNTVCVIDDCGRLGVENNIQHLNDLNIQFVNVDISRFNDLKKVFYEFSPDIIIHMAAQVAVTLSTANPAHDFRCNVQGSFNLLELVRHSHQKPIILYASTNKVYGSKSQQVELKNGHYTIKNHFGYDEETLLSFETPYGCSKGAADQYFLDYARTYGLPTVVFRQSCIYGPNQYGVEDQGWLAWFCIRAYFNKPITIYGDGYQVRDVLYIDDLVDLYEKAIINIDSVKGEVFNIGGGPENILSPNDLVKILEKKVPHPVKISYADWRLSDQKVYISDIRKAQACLEWQPFTTPHSGIDKLLHWIHENQNTIDSFHSKQESFGKKCDVSIVIPAKNEQDSIGKVLDEISLLLMESTYSFEVIVVNDRSTDKTAEVVKEYPFVKLVNNCYPPGKGAALRTGFEIARGSYLVMMDADFSHDVSDLPTMIEEIRKHNGLVIASRIMGGSEEYTRMRAFGNIILTWFFGFFHGRYLSDALNGFKIFHRDIYWTYEYNANGYEIEIELLVNTLRLKRKVTEASARERARLGGKVKSSIVRDGTKFLLRIFQESFRKPKLRDIAQLSTVSVKTAQVVQS